MGVLNWANLPKWAKLLLKTNMAVTDSTPNSSPQQYKSQAPLPLFPKAFVVFTAPTSPPSLLCTIDFCRLDEGFGGKTYKRKRQESQITSDAVNSNDAAIGATSMDVDDSCPPPSKRSAVPSSGDTNKPNFDPPTYDGVIAGKVSGRNWKERRKQRASAKQVSIKRTLEGRERQKEIKGGYRERMNELKEEIRQNEMENRKKREERERRRRKRILRSGTKLQKITNPNTLQKIAKSKQKKLFQVVPDEFVNKKSKEKKKNLCWVQCCLFLLFFFLRYMYCIASFC
ncbi:LOW QUALITY PROTEIN: MAP7 domain-containing protein 1-like [Durio zibethinus]|uniref:Coiled-coil domain-containing protein 86 n=1 Tax=Durio zibethinus TaxID=66656 RepID=A0A6P6BEK6_DURZI|nr:LOW QUALITY PROTEIN: MAP7 domain-containing protein 1-like [Durio zibethinus]